MYLEAIDALTKSYQNIQIALDDNRQAKPICAYITAFGMRLSDMQCIPGTS